MKKLPYLAIAALFLLWPVALIVPSCQSFKSLQSFEEVSQEEADAFTANCALIAKVGAARLIREGKCSRATINDAAAVLEIASLDPLTLGGPNVLTAALKAAGFTDDEALLAIALAESVLRQQFNLGKIGSPLGPHARSLLSAVAVALTEAAKDGASQEDQAKAATIVEAYDAR